MTAPRIDRWQVQQHLEPCDVLGDLEGFFVYMESGQAAEDYDARLATQHQLWRRNLEAYGEWPAPDASEA